MESLEVRPAHEMENLYARLAARNAHVFPGRVRVPPRARTVIRPPAQLAREIEAFQSRFQGGRRVMWACLPALSFSDPDLHSVLWIRFPSGLMQRFAFYGDPRCNPADSGEVHELPENSRAFFEQHVRGHLTPEHTARALKLGFGSHTTHLHHGLRDHPFTPGVRENYELRTTYHADTFTPDGQHTPARRCWFRATRSTTRVQLRGRNLLLLQGGRVTNLKYGRADLHRLSAPTRAGLQALAWELAEREQPQALTQLENTFGPRDVPLAEGRLQQFLFAVQHPEYLNVPGLIHHLHYADGKSYRRWLRTRPQPRAFFRQLAGTWPRTALTWLHRPDLFRFATVLHAGGITAPERKVRLLHIYREAVLEQPPEAVDPAALAWYVQWAGGEAPAEARLTRAFQTRRSLAEVLSLLEDAQRMWQEIHDVTGGPPLVPRDARDPFLLHDHLARLHRRLTTENQPIPTAAAPEFAHLDLDVPHPEYGLLHFRRARETHELIHVGEALHNCVSSYAASALKGNLVIVNAWTPQGTPVFCLEIQDRTLRQFKQDRNCGVGDTAHLSTALAYVQHARLHVQTHDLDTGGQDLPF